MCFYIYMKSKILTTSRSDHMFHTFFKINFWYGLHTFIEEETGFIVL